MIVYLSVFVPQEHSNEKWSFLFSLSMSTMYLDFCFFGFFSSHGWMWELDHKEGWMSKNWRLNCGAGEDSWQSLALLRRSNQSILEEINPVYSLEWLKCWGWSSNTLADEKSQLIGKDPAAGKDWGQEEKEVREDEMVGWYHWVNVHEFEQAQR